MSAPGQRHSARYALRRIRLVNFHNLVDETIEIREGGHLFLLGDNGSGKTTVLDAIHLALTGALQVELNAAARVAAGRDAGRSLQGVVLRYDAERGVRNEGGASAYALLEIVHGDDGSAVCLGVGIEATTMDADVRRLGIFTRTPLDQIPLIELRLDGRVPAAHDALRAVLGKHDTYPRMTEYRKVIADRLFGGASAYDEVCRFWTMAKAYREIVAKARDFETLFMRLLPAPDAQTFDDILRSLRALDELEGLVERLARQREYAAGLAALVKQIRVHREEIARYRWLISFRQRAAVQKACAGTARELEQTARERERAAAEVSQARGALEQARHALSAATSSEASVRLQELRHSEAQLARDQGDEKVAAQAWAEEQADQRRAERDLELQRRSFAEHRRAQAEALGSRAEKAASLEHPLTETRAAAAAELTALETVAAPESAWLPAPERARAETAALERAERAAQEGRQLEQHRAEAERDRCRERLAELRRIEEEVPEVPGFASARCTLAAAGVPASPLYELLEPRASARSQELAALEALLGDAALATFVVPADQVPSCRAQLLPHDGVRLAARVASDAELAPWVAELLSERCDRYTRGVLATLLSQAPSLGLPQAPDRLGDLEHRGAALRPLGTCRLIGIEARRRAHRARVQEAELRLAAAERALTESATRLEAGARALAAAAQVVAALAALRDAEANGRHARLEAARDKAAFLSSRANKSAGDLERAAERRRESEGRVEALRAAAHQAGAEAIERSIAALRAQEDLARSAEARANEAVAEAAAQQRALGARRDRQHAELADLELRLDSDSERLLAALTELGQKHEAVELERYVRVTQRGDQFLELDNIEDRLRQSERQEIAVLTEIEGDGSRGVRNLEWAGSFGFAWSASDLRVTDRRDQPLASVLAQLERELIEQQAVVNERTQELMSKLVMGDLARELQTQVERLYRTIKEINSLLAGLRFGPSRYAFKLAPHPHAKELVELVRKLSILDQHSRDRFREFIDERLAEVRQLGEHDEVPELLDYRRWFDYRLSVSSGTEAGTDLTRELRALGSGGEQGVPNYLLVLALAKLMFDNARAKIRPLLFDEAFYGIDAGRRDQLLKFATELDLDLVVASPDQDGVTPSARRTTTLFLLKDEHGDVHLAPYHYWNDTGVQQPSLFAERADEPDPNEAECVLGTP